MASPESDRLTDAEAIEVARRYTERLVAREASERTRREREAETTSVVEVASLLGATSDEIRALTHDVRKAEVDRRAKFRTDPVGLAIVLLIMGLPAAVILYSYLTGR